jgi:biotin carboxyl carrier protein
MYKATINGKQFEITEADNKLLVNGEAVDLNSTEVSDGYFHILLKNKSYRAEVVKVDHSTKTFTFKINGRIYPVVLKNKFDLLLEKMGMSGNATSKVNNIKAPMPGLIIDLRVKEGDQVNTGDTLIILEAMKMENSIKSPGQAQVKSVKVKKGESVEKGQTLIEFL